MKFKKSNKVFIHVDCDSFFASCEVLRNPKLKGKYVCVGDEIIIACTYNCKSLGIKTGTPVWEARKILKNHMVLIKPDHYYYEEVSSKLFEYLKANTCLFEAFSIDEAFCEISGLAEYYKVSLDKYLSNTQKDILKNIGIPVSIGCSNTRIKAKIFSKINKPYGIYIGLGDERELFEKLPLKDIPFIGKRYGERLKFEAKTIYDFINMGYWKLKSIIGKNATDLWLELSGVNAFVVKKSLESKSISRSRSFNKNITNDREFLFSQMLFHFDRLFEDITTRNIEIKIITLMFRTKEFETLYYSYKLKEYSNIRSELLRVLEQLFVDNYNNKKLYRSVGVVFGEFRSYLPRQSSLFDKPLRSKDNNYVLYKAINSINKKYGTNKISFGVGTLGLGSDLKLGIRK